MSRKRVNEIGALQTRADLWNTIRSFVQPAADDDGAVVARPFTVGELHRETRCTLDQVRDYLLGLVNAGILERSPDPVGPVKRTYTLIKDVGNEPPRVRRDGSFVAMGRGREQLWQTMRALSVFTFADLQVAASTDEHPVAFAEAKTYCQVLHKAGYLAKGAMGYRLIRYTGPLPPMIQRVKNVYDPNLKQVICIHGEE